MILLLKIFLAPVIIIICSLVLKKYGHSAAGVLIGMPLTSGPLSFILTIQNGKTFVADFANGVQLGVVSVSLFCLIYVWSSQHFHWFICLLSGFIVYFFSTFICNKIALPIYLSFLISVIITFLVLQVFPPLNKVETITTLHQPDILLRVFLAVLIIFIISYLAIELGPQLSGIISAFPVYSGLFTATAHVHYGPEAAKRMMFGILLGCFSFSMFFLVLGILINTTAIAISYLLAIFFAIVIQLLINRFYSRYKDY